MEHCWRPTPTSGDAFVWAGDAFTGVRGRHGCSGLMEGAEVALGRAEGVSHFAASAFSVVDFTSRYSPSETIGLGCR